MRLPFASLRRALTRPAIGSCLPVPVQIHYIHSSYATSPSASEQAPARSRVPVPSAVCRCDQARIARNFISLDVLVVFKMAGQVLGLLINYQHRYG